MTNIVGPYDPEAAFVSLAQTSHSEVVVEEILSRQPRSLFATTPATVNKASAIVPDAKYVSKPAVTKPGSLFAPKINGMLASTEVVTQKKNPFGGPGKPKIGPNFLEELKLKSQLRTNTS